MSRSSWKNPRTISLPDNSKTKYRSAFINPECVGKTLYVHNGYKFVSIRIHENQIGFKLGEFVLTKKRVFHKKKKKK
jgi:ribosomal protein S19